MERAAGVRECLKATDATGVDGLKYYLDQKADTDGGRMHALKKRKRRAEYDSAQFTSKEGRDVGKFASAHKSVEKDRKLLKRTTSVQKALFALKSDDRAAAKPLAANDNESADFAFGNVVYSNVSSTLPA